MNPTSSLAEILASDARLLIGAALLSIGGLLLLIAAFGQLRLPDVYMRLHALAPSFTWGGALVLAALAIGSGDMRFAVRALVLAGMLAVIGPVLSHILANGAHAAGLAPRVGELNADNTDAP